MAPTTTPKIEATRSHTSSHLQSSGYPSSDADFERAVNKRIKELVRANKLKLVYPSTGRYMPRYDLCDDPISNLVTATIELPGIKRDDITLNIDRDILVVKGKRNRPKPKHLDESSLPSNPTAYADAIASGELDADEQTIGPQFKVAELRYGYFERKIPLPSGTQNADIRAHLSDGMLWVTWPRRSRSQVPPERDSQSTSSK